VTNRSRPIWIAAIGTLALRAVYSLYGALMFHHLYLDPRLIRSNSFTNQLIPTTDTLRYVTLGLWERFDTLWYIHIAQFGYDRPASIVFYPLYPALIRAASWILHPPLAASLVVSTFAAFFFFWGMQLLVELDQDANTALRAAWFAAIWPASFILFAGYAEPLVMAFTVWAIYFARQSRWPLAGALAFLAGATKAVGCFVFFPLAFLGLKNKTWRAWTSLLTLVPPLAFSLWTRRAGFPPVSQVYPKYWAVTMAFPLVTAAQCVVRFLAGGLDLLFKLNFASLVIVGALSLLKRIRAEYQLYAVAVILLFLTKSAQPLLNETLRYVLVVFPAYISLALLVKRPSGFILLSAFLLFVHAVLLLKFFEWSLVA